MFILFFKSTRTCEAAFGGPQCSRLWVQVCLYSSASDGKVLGCGLDSSVFCHQSACPSLLPCGFSTSAFVKGSRRRLPIKLRELIAARLPSQRVLVRNSLWLSKAHFVRFSSGFIRGPGDGAHLVRFFPGFPIVPHIFLYLS